MSLQFMSLFLTIEKCLAILKMNCQKPINIDLIEKHLFSRWHLDFFEMCKENGINGLSTHVMFCFLYSNKFFSTAVNHTFLPFCLENFRVFGCVQTSRQSRILGSRLESRASQHGCANLSLPRNLYTIFGVVTSSFAKLFTMVIAVLHSG